MNEKVQGEQSIQEQYAEIGKRKKMSNKVKGHFKRHKNKYIVGGAVTAGVGVGIYIGKKLGVEVDNTSNLVNKALLNIKPTNVQQNTYITQLVRRGHAGNAVRCIETGEEFASQNRACDLLKLNKSDLSNHLHGLKDSVKGMHFEKIGDFNNPES